MRIRRFNKQVFDDIFRFFNHDYGVYLTPEVFLIKNVYIRKTGYYSSKDEKIKRYIYVTFDYNMDPDPFVFCEEGYENNLKI